MRTRRSRSDDPGFSRRRRGRGFSYSAPDGSAVTDPQTLDRIAQIAIPPAWTDVWICSDERGHLQAAGTDADGRRQYRYHPAWTARAGREKYVRVRALAGRMTPLRRAITRDLRGDDPAARAAAIAARLIDVLGMRLGDERYAVERGTVGALTLTRQHLELDAGAVRLDFPAKSGVRWVAELRDPTLSGAITAALADAPRGADARLTQWRDDAGHHRLSSRRLTAYLVSGSGHSTTPKDLRTLLGSRTAAEALARTGMVTAGAQDAAIREAVDAVAERLRNTRAVALASYIDPVVIERYRRGRVAALRRTGVSDRAYAELVSSAS